MEIKSSDLAAATVWARLGDLHILLSQTEKETRPCSTCDVACSTCGSKGCLCNCSPNCEHTDKHLSSDPERFPIEPHIVPLVYALQSLKVCPPCWSCEGHLKSDGSPLRFPSVWFHSHSVVYPHIIHESLQAKAIRSKLSCSWAIGIKSWGEMIETTFAIQPDLVEGVIPSLDTLWADIEFLGNNLAPEVLRLARTFLEEANRASLETG